jgi:site-specific DNA recombinase
MGTAYPGEHAAVIDGQLWDKVHALINGSPQTRAKRPLGRTPAFLKGLVFGPTGAAMTPTYTRKAGRLYCYYVSHDVIGDGKSPSPIRRVPAAQIEIAVLAQIRELVKSPEIVVATWRAARKSLKDLAERQVRDELHRFDALWTELFPAEQARIVQLLVQRVDISERGADITLRVEGLSNLIQDLRAGADSRIAA